MLRRKLLKQIEGNSRLPDWFSSIGGPQAPQRVIASWAFRSAGFAFPIVLALMPLLIQGMAAQGIRGAKSEGATLRGTVHDRSGKLVGDAHVVLLGGSSQATREASTNAAGGFTFPGVAMGSFSLTANSGPSRSATVSLTVSTPGEQSPVDLVLDASDAQRSAAPKDVDKAMQFADNPDFAIATVTDWTAAGDTVRMQAYALAKR